MADLERVLGLLHPARTLGALLYLGLLVALGILGTTLIRRAARRALERDRADRTAVMLLRPLAQVVLWASLAVFYAHLIPPLRALGTAMLAGASVASIILGVAAQNTLGNAIAGLALLVYRPFRVGDRLQVLAPTGVETGVVESITLGYTVLQTLDNRRVVLANSQLSMQTTVNLTSVDPRVMAQVAIGVGYAADLTRARAILRQLAEAHPDAVEVVDCPVIQLGASSVTLNLRAWCHDPVAARRFEYAMYEGARERFAEAGIEIPYPYQNVILRRSR